MFNTELEPMKCDGSRTQHIVNINNLLVFFFFSVFVASVYKFLLSVFQLKLSTRKSRINTINESLAESTS